MRRVVFAVIAVLIACCTLPASAAAHVLVVFPFAVSGSVPDELGAAISKRIGDQVAALGGVQVDRLDGVKPLDYRAAAQKAGADYYLSGSIVLVFNRYSATEQLVGTRSGTLQWASPLQFRTLDDVIGEGARVRAAMLQGDPPAVTATFDYLVLATTGTALRDDPDYAQRALVNALIAAGARASNAPPGTSPNLASSGPPVCSGSGAKALVAPDIEMRNTGRVAAPQATAVFTVHVYDCATHALAAQVTSAQKSAPVSEAAVDAAATDLARQLRGVKP